MSTEIDDLFNAAPMARPRPEPEDILSAMDWSEPREVETKKGPRLVSNAVPTPEFLELYETRRQWLYERGYTYSMNRFAGNMQVAHWQLLPEKIVIDRKEEIEASRATDADISVPVPEGLSYLGYQKAGIAFGYRRPAVLIGDEMGLGKTIQAIGIMNADPTIQKILIICPASLKLNWRRELQKWLVNKRPIIVADSKMFCAIAGVSIINYDILHKHIDAIRCTIWDMVVVDEAHFLKNRKARRTQMVFGAKATKKEKANGMADVPSIQARKKVFLTGTPIANKPAELFPLINYLDPIAWPNFFSYAKRYCAAHCSAFGWDMDGASHLDELQDKLRSGLMIRRLKKDVLTELPPKRRQIIEFTASGEARALIQREKAAYEARDGQMASLQAQVELAKASDDEEVYRDAVKALRAGMGAVFSELATIRRETAEAKAQMKEILEHIDDAVENSGKVILFAHHKQPIALLAHRFGSSCVTLVGETCMEDRQAAVDRFQKDPTCKLFIGSLLAAGVGITLTASSHVLFLEGDWVPGNNSQAEDRAHRIGQRESVLIQHLVLEGSIDAIILKRVIGKQEIIDMALDKAAAPEEVIEAVSSDGKENATTDTPREKLAREEQKMTEAQRKAAHEALKMLASRCNGARDWDGAGFSKIDTMIGKDLAARDWLSPKQAALARKIAWKYRGQLGAEFTSILELK